MAVKVNVGDRVEIKAGDERGGWGIVRLVTADAYHVAPYNGKDVRVYTRSEISKPRAAKTVTADKPTKTYRKNPEGRREALKDLSAMIEAGRVEDGIKFVEGVLKSLGRSQKWQGACEWTITAYREDENAADVNAHRKWALLQGTVWMNYAAE